MQQRLATLTAGSSITCPMACPVQIQKSAKHYTDAARDEITLLAQISNGDPHNCKHCVRLYDYFEHCGPNGRHVCMVFDVSHYRWHVRG